MSSPVAFFDLDRTLIDVNSALLFAQFERRRGRISSLMLARAAAWTFAYHLNLLDIEKAYDYALAHYRGTSWDELDRLTKGWFETDVARRLVPGGRRAIDEHRAHGHRCVLITNSSCFAADAATATFGLDAWIANLFERDENGLLTGRFERPLCYGAGKITRANAWLETNGGELGEAFFYTDSLSDLPMLEVVGQPRIINPDPRLKREAKRRGWPIVDWSR
jgi:HAD superfamily hydrolase (TIGR01490 family)